MVEVTSGNIQIGTKYTVSNIVDGTGYITYRTVQYTHGKSFVGQVANDVFSTSTPNMKVYMDDVVVDIVNTNTSEIEDEISPYPESVVIHNNLTAENFSDNEIVVFPENVKINNFLTVEALKNRSQILKKSII